MRVKCTITIDDWEYSTTVSGNTLDETLVADTIRGCTGAINSQMNCNLVGSFITANMCVDGDIPMLRDAGWVELKLDMENEESYNYLIVVSRKVASERTDLPNNVIAVDDVAALRAKLTK
jgi:hypothetical protein